MKVAQTNSEIQANELELEASQSDWDAAKSQNKPQVNLLASTTFSQIFAPNGGLFPQASSFVELRKNLWNRAIDSQIQTKRLEYNEKKASNIYTEATVLRRFSMLYIDWINARQSLDIYKKQAQILKKMGELNKKRYGQFDDTRLTSAQTQIRLLNAESQVTTLEERCRTLEQRIGLESGVSPIGDVYPQDFESVFAYLLSQNKKDNAYLGEETREARLLLADANIQATKDAWGARLDFVTRAGATNYSATNTFRYSGKSVVSEIGIGLELIIPLYDGNAHNHSLRASMQRRNAIEERNKAELMLLRTQLLDWKTAETLNTSINRTYNDIQKLIESRYNGLEIQLRAGANTLFELLNANEEALSIERQHIVDYQQKLQSDVEISVSHNLLNLSSLEEMEKHFGESHE
jgi:outer membrane protein TolC